MDITALPLERPSMRAARYVPELDGLIISSRRKRLAIWREGDRSDQTVVLLERLQMRTTRYVPEPDGLIISSRPKRPAVWRRQLYGPNRLAPRASADARRLLRSRAG